MPNEHETLTSLFSDIADAIREKTGGTAPIVADDFPDEIAEITTEPTLQSKTVSPSTSQQVVEADDGYDGLDKVTVNAMRLQRREYQQTERGIGAYIRPEDGYDGLSEVQVHPARLQTATLTENKTYAPDEGYLGFERVTVNAVGKPTRATVRSLDTQFVVAPRDYGDYNSFTAVDVFPPTLETLTAIANGSYRAGADKFYKDVVVNVPEKTLTTKTVVANGTYNASADNADGYSQVTVAIPIYDGSVV